MSRTRGFLILLVLGGAYALTGCGPTYPKCDNDEHCKVDGHEEFCVNKLCEQCRDNSHCEGPGMMCATGKCMQRPGYCDPSVACPSGQKCRDNECGAECLDNAECTGNTYCAAGRCLQKPDCGEGADTPACAEGMECSGGHCIHKVAQCTAEAVYFSYDRSSIKRRQRSKIDAVAACLQGEHAGAVRVEGHTDERGTEEYNLALGQSRAQAVKRYLVNKGVPTSKLTTSTMGEQSPAKDGSNEGAWSKNRRAEFISR